MADIDYDNPKLNVIPLNVFIEGKVRRTIQGTGAWCKVVSVVSMNWIPAGHQQGRMEIPKV